MSKKEKLIKRMKLKPKDFTFDEAETLLVALGFKISNKGKTSGSKVLFVAGDVHIHLHKPHPRKELKGYQLNQIIEVLVKEGFI